MRERGGRNREGERKRGSMSDTERGREREREREVGGEERERERGIPILMLHLLPRFPVTNIVFYHVTVQCSVKR